MTRILEELGLLLRRLGLERGEGRRTGLMFGYIFLVIAALLIVKPVRNSLFLNAFGPEKLPYAFILVALVSGLVAFGYARLARRFALDRLIGWWVLFCTICFLGSWALLRNGYQARWFIYSFYVWGAIFGVISASQFWLLANYVFNAREAKRIFGLLGAGGIAGGILGGYLTRYLAPVLGTEQLLFLCVGFLWICLVLLRLVWRRPVERSFQESAAGRRRDASAADSDNPVKLILQSRHLTYMAVLVGMGVIVASLVDYQFNTIASRSIPDEDQLTAFFGFWFSNLSIGALVVQLFLTGRVLRRVGVGASLYFLPGAVFVGALVILFFPALGAAVLIKLCEGGFKQSINKAGLELLAVPIPAWIKNQTKTVIDVFVDNAATGVSGLLLVLLTITLGLGVRHISLVIVALIGVWGFFILLAQREYVNSFRLAIEKRNIDTEDPTITLDDASAFQIIQRVLEGDNARQILYVLQMAEDASYDRMAPFFERLIHHSSSSVKAQVLRMARNTSAADLSEPAQALVRHYDADVRGQAIRYLCHRSPDRIATLETLLKDEDLGVQTAAIVAAAEEYRRDESTRRQIDIVSSYREVFVSPLRTALNPSEETFLKVRAAEVIGIARVPELYVFLHKLLLEEAVEVLRASLTSAGHVRAPEFVPQLIRHLGTRAVRGYARNALARYGEEVVDELAVRLRDSDEARDVVHGVVRVLGMIESQGAVDVLLEHAAQESLGLRLEVINALSNLRADFASLKFDRRRVEALIIGEVKEYSHLLVTLYQHQDMGDRTHTEPSDRVGSELAQNLLRKAIQERIDRALERIFLLLGLRYSPEDIHNAYRGILSRRPHLRANAIEFLDNLLDHPLKRYILPAVEQAAREDQVQDLPSLYDVTALLGTDYLARLLEGPDDWLKACALLLIAQLRDSRWLDEARTHTHSIAPIVKETAEYAIHRLRTSG